MAKQRLRCRPGVYAIINKVNGKRYIGSTVDLSKRLSEHRRALVRGIHSNPHLQRAWNKYGSDSFDWTIVERCDVDDLLAREQHWIDFHRCRRSEHGYNSRPVAATSLGVKLSDETRARMSAAHKGKGPSRHVIELSIVARKGRPIPPERVENIKAALARKRAEGWRHPFVPPPPPPIPPEKVAEIRAMLASGLAQKKIGQITGVSHSSVSRIHLRKYPYQ